MYFIPYQFLNISFKVCSIVEFWRERERWNLFLIRINTRGKEKKKLV